MAEAVAAAQALTPDLEQQVDITAGLMSLTPEEARSFVLDTPPLNLPRSSSTRSSPRSRSPKVMRPGPPCTRPRLGASSTSRWNSAASRRTSSSLMRRSTRRQGRDRGHLRRLRPDLHRRIAAARAAPGV